MRFELIIFVIAGFLIANIYTDGKYLKMLQTGKKYYQMAGIAFGALMLYLLLKHNPLRAQQIVSTTNDYIKYLPIDKNTSNMLSPILDFTSKQNFAGDQYASIDGGSFNYPVAGMPQHGGNNAVAESRILQSGKKATKRSVSETKKKFVASRQNWKCGECQSQLNAWFEVDHIKRLEYGGSNHIDNLVALCRECHGKKTTIENL
jgi:5-methylcytosine-specific restriction endonuclease McrA